MPPRNNLIWLIQQTKFQLVRDAFDQPSSAVQTKASNTDLVTETDQAVEKLLIKGLGDKFPDHKWANLDGEYPKIE